VRKSHRRVIARGSRSCLAAGNEKRLLLNTGEGEWRSRTGASLLTIQLWRGTLVAGCRM